MYRRMQGSTKPRPPAAPPSLKRLVTACFIVRCLPKSELDLIREIRRRAAPVARGSKAARRGIGDDCAVLRTGTNEEVLVTTDFSLEGVHFRREWHPPDSVGHRCLARGLSDIAAMGGDPLASFLSLALPAKLPQSWVDKFFDGLLALTRKYGIELAGGDISQSPNSILADIIVIGSAPRGQAVLRSGAKPGDQIYVTGALGGSAAALQRLFEQPKKRLRATEYPEHFYPEPRVTAGRWLRKHKIASSMMWALKEIGVPDDRRKRRPFDRPHAYLRRKQGRRAD